MRTAMKTARMTPRIISTAIASCLVQRQIRGRRAAHAATRNPRPDPAPRTAHPAIRIIDVMHCRTHRAALIVLALLAAACGGRSTGPTTPSPATPAQSWSDEFDGAANTLPNAAKWTYDLGGGGWG